MDFKAMDFKFLRSNAIAKAPNGDLVGVVTYWFDSVKEDWMVKVMELGPYEEKEGVEEWDISEWDLSTYPLSTLTYVEGGEPSFIDGICPYKTIKDVKTALLTCNTMFVNMVIGERLMGINHKYNPRKIVEHGASMSYSGSKKKIRKRARGLLNKSRIPQGKTRNSRNSIIGFILTNESGT